MEPGEVVLEVKDLHAKDYRGVEILKGFNPVLPNTPQHSPNANQKHSKI